MTHIAGIGAGITGSTTAYALARRGFAVSVFDRNRYAAMETSFANGGQLSASNAEVWTRWGTIFKGLKWMLKSDAPLLVNPKPSWHKLSWMAEFMGNIPDYERHTIETARLAIAARDHLKASGLRVLGNGEPKIGAHGKPVLFLHPKDFNGCLVELEQV